MWGGHGAGARPVSRVQRVLAHAGLVDVSLHGGSTDGSPEEGQRGSLYALRERTWGKRNQEETVVLLPKGGRCGNEKWTDL